MFDIEATLKRYERDALLQDMNVSNVLLSFLNEIHLKERHGSPLDTETMKARLMKYAQENQGALRDGLSTELRRYDEANTPRWKRLRRTLQRAGLFYLAADMMRRVSNRIKTRDNLKYSDDCFSGRPLMKMEQRLSATIQSNND